MGQIFFGSNYFHLWCLFFHIIIKSTIFGNKNKSPQWSTRHIFGEHFADFFTSKNFEWTFAEKRVEEKQNFSNSDSNPVFKEERNCFEYLKINVPPFLNNGIFFWRIYEKPSISSRFAIFNLKLLKYTYIIAILN